MKRIALALLTLVILASTALAEVPRTMNIQGVLTDPAGNPVMDGDYNVNFLFYTSEFATSPILNNDWDVQVTDGLFSHVLDMEPWLDFGDFENELWLGIAISGEPEQTPRIRLTTVPYAFRAAIADSVAGGGGVGDTDWEIVGEDIYRHQGQVYVGVSVPGARGAREEDEEPRGGGRLPSSSKLHVETPDQTAVYGKMTDTDGLEDQRAGLYGYRHRYSRNDGTGFGTTDVSGGVLGYNSWGDSYTFGVAGHSWLDYPHAAGVLGADNSGALWAALAYKDAGAITWGFYTPVNAHVGGTLQLPSGASAGHILTSDASGNASWQPPGSASTDGDWTISGDHLYHAAAGTVALGTDTPSPMTASQTMLQVNASIWPSLALDSEANGFSRWVILNEGIGDELEFGYTTDPGSYPSIQMQLAEDGRLAVGNTLSGATLSLGAGNGDLSVGNGDFYVGGNSFSFKLGVHTDGAQAGEVNLRADANLGGGVLDLGVDNHDVISIHDHEVEVVDSSGDLRMLVTTEDDMGDTGGTLYLYGSPDTTPELLLSASTSGAGRVDVRQPGGNFAIRMEGNGASYSGGEIRLFNGSGVQTLELDAHHDGSGQSRITTASLEITGGADLSEQFDVGDGDTAAEPGMVLSIDPDRPGRLALSDRAYDHRVAGVISGAGGVRTGMLMGQQGSVADGELPVALAGRVYVWADAANGPIEPGDLLTTADRPGHAMRVEDPQRAGGAILGKAMTALPEGRGLVLVLVSLQ